MSLINFRLILNQACKCTFGTTSIVRKKVEKLDDLEEPIKFTMSKAAEWKAKNTRMGRVPDNEPPIQMYSILFSITIFLIYFCYLREENDIDQDLERSLFDHVPGLEEKQLVLAYKYSTLKSFFICSK
jgi:hypothetical protein